jgi:hypothetical protein
MLISTDDHLINPDLQGFMAQRMGTNREVCFFEPRVVDFRPV